MADQPADKAAQGLAALLRDMGGRITGWTAAAPKVHDFVLARLQEHVASEGRDTGTPWAPLEAGEPKWAALKAALGADPRPLRWEPGVRERLVPSIINRRHPLHVFEVRGGDVRVGTRVQYARRHDEGIGLNPFGEKIPARRLVGMSKRGRGRLSQLLAIYIVRGETRGNKWDK